MADRFHISPFEVLNQPLDDVVAVWTGAVISANAKSDKQNKKKDEGERVWVDSRTATWH